MFQVCGAIQATNNGKFSSDVGVGKTYQETGTLKCQAGYKLANSTGNANTSVGIKCTADGEWNVTTITCEKKGTV